MNPETILYIPQDEKLCYLAIKTMCNNSFTVTAVNSRILLLSIKESRRTSCCDTIQLFNCMVTKYHKEKVISHISYWNNSMVQLIHQKYSNYFHLVPQEYQTIDAVTSIVHANPQLAINYDVKLLSDELLQKAVLCNPKLLEKIPHERQNITMIDSLLSNKFYCDHNIHLLKCIKPLKVDDILHYVAKNEHVATLIDVWEEHLAAKVFQLNRKTFPYLPPKFMTPEMCSLAVAHNREYIQYIDILSEEIFQIIDDGYKGYPKKYRWDFINNFSEATLIKIVAVRPYLLDKISKQTDKIITTALQKCGYCLQYVRSKTDEYEAMALQNEPKAIKYFRSFEKLD